MCTMFSCFLVYSYIRILRSISKRHCRPSYLGARPDFKGSALLADPFFAASPVLWEMWSRRKMILGSELPRTTVLEDFKP